MAFSSKKQHRSGNSGVAILFAVLTAAVLAAISVSIFNIAVRELKLSSIAEESLVAFYAADSAVECVLYWDLVGNLTDTAFAKISYANGGSDPADLPVPVECTNMVNHPFNVPVWTTEPVARTVGGLDDQQPQVNLQFLFPAMNDACAIVTVTKSHQNPADIYSPIMTSVRSYGRNSCNVQNPRRLERGIVLNY